MATENQPTNPSGQDDELTKPENIPVLDLVRKQLQGNKDLFTAGEVITCYDFIQQTIGIIVAPVNPIYELEELNRSMDGLIKDIKPSLRYKSDTMYDYQGGIELGHIDFIERIEYGRTRITQIRMYPDILSATTIFDHEKGVKDGNIPPNFNPLSIRVTDNQIRRLKAGLGL